MRPTQGVSKFKIYEESTKADKYWANYADENVLLATHQFAKGWVDLTDPVIQYISTHAPSLETGRTSLQNMLQGTGKVRVVDADYVRWKLRGTGEVQAVSLENQHSGLAAPGAHGTRFGVKLDLESFIVGDILAPDVAKEASVVVEELPQSHGSGFIYQVTLADKNPNAFFPPELLESHLKWIKIGAVYGEASRGYGSTQFMGLSYVEFQSSLSDWGKHVEVTNKAHQTNLKLLASDAKGNILKDYPAQIISYIEAEFLRQAKWEKELMLYYGRDIGRTKIDETSGHHRRGGPGLMEFLEDGNVIDYPVEAGSVDMFVEFLQSVWFDRVPPEQRNIVIYTGQGGLKLWDDWITEKYAVSAVESDFDKFVGPSKSFDSKNFKGYQFPINQFTKYNIKPFGSVSVAHWGILDSTYLNGSLLHPSTGLPLSSYQFIVLDHGLGSGGSSNIELLKRKDSEVYSYQCGTWSPAGPINNRGGKGQFVCTGPNRSYTLYAADTFGIRVKDVSLTAMFLPSVTL